MELFTFGMLGQLYDILIEGDQWAVSGAYGLTPEALAALIDSAVEARNICAHYGRLYNQPLARQPLLPPEYANYAGDRVFPLLLALRAVAGGSRVYGRMARGIAQLAEDFPLADLSLCGFPPEWEALLRG